MQEEVSTTEKEEGFSLIPGMIMRNFTPRDVLVVKEITEQSLGEDYPLSLFLDIHGWWPEGFVVAEMDGEVVGFIAGITSAPRQARVLMLAVREGFRGRGIGTALMSEFTRRCLARGIRSMELEVRKSNLQAIRFYNRLGFSIQYILPRFYTDGEDGYKMWKSLR